MKSRRFIRWVAVVQIGLTVMTGCTPTRPFYNRNNPSLANYMDQAMSIEYADVQVESLAEATQTFEPFTHERMPDQFHDWSLEDCISIGLQNAKILVSTPGTNLQSGSMAASLLTAQPGQIPSAYDPALVALTGNTQPLAVDSQGTRVSQRGSVRANQVGGVEQALSEFDAQYSSILAYNTTHRPRNVGQGNVFNPQLFNAKDSSLQNAISKKLATGTIVTARANTVYSKNNVPASGNAPGSLNFGRAVVSDWTASLEMQINQPLMRGRGTLVNRIPVVLARINEDISLHQFEANTRNLLRDIEHAYWDLYLGYRAVDAARVARDAALNLWRVAKERSANSDTDPAAVAQAEGRVAQFEAQLHIAINGSNVPGNDPLGLVGRERLLREKLGLAATDGFFIRPSDMPTEARIAFEWDQVLSEGLSRNTELRLAKWAIKQRELEHMSAKNQLLPQLDVVGTYRWLGVGDKLIAANRTGLDFPNPGSIALENFGDFQEVGARVEYTPTPFGARREKGNINSTLFALKKSHEELKEKERDLSLLLSAAWSGVHSGFTSAANYLDQLRANQQEIDLYLEKIANDTGEMNVILDQLLRAEESKARAELQYHQSLVEYNKSIVNVHYLKGSLFDLNNVSLGEGAWVEKAYWDAERRADERAAGLYFDYGYTRPSVVSNGPVEAGGVTEGNLSDTTPRMSAPVVQPEEVDANEAGSQDGNSILNKGDDQNKSTRVTRPGMVQPTSATMTIGDAGSPAPVVRADQFQWGNLGLGEENSGLRPAATNDLKSVPKGSQNPAKSSFRSQLGSDEMNYDAAPTNELRSTTSSSPAAATNRVPSGVSDNTQAGSIQWRSRN